MELGRPFGKQHPKRISNDELYNNDRGDPNEIAKLPVQI
jgi:hypothetical protein